MAVHSVLVCLSLVLLAAGADAAAATCTVQSGNACVCKSDNASVDISKAFKGDRLNLTDSEEKYWFLISPCEPFACNKGDVPSAVCQVVRENGDTFSCGRTTEAVFTVTNSSSFTLFLKGGDKYTDQPSQEKYTRTTRVTVSISNKADNLTYIEETTEIGQKRSVYSFALNIKKGGGNIAGIAGIVIIILLLVGVIAYFVIGAIVMYTVKGARGVEVIPNYTFWKSLPFLIKDGCVFVVSPCTTKCGREKGYTSL